MGFFAPSIRQISTVGGILATLLLVVLGYTTSQTNWSNLVFDKPAGTNIIDINSINFPTDIPLSPLTIQEMKAPGSQVPSIQLEVSNYSRHKSGSKAYKPFGDQIAGKLAAIQNMDDQYYGFYFDIDMNKISTLDSPTLFFHRIADKEWTVYFNDQLVATGTAMDSYQSIRLPEPLPNALRASVIIKSRHASRLAGLYFTYGLTIRSAKEAAWAQQNLPAQHQYPRILAAVFLGVFALVGFAMAFSTPQYSDIWAYAAFCGTMAGNVWKQTPFFWGSFEWSSSGVSMAHDVAWLSFVLIFMLTAVVLNLSFFRIRGHWFRVITFGALASAIWVFYRNYPGWNPDVKSYQAYANVGRAVVVLLLFSQGVGSLLGFTDLYKALLHAKKSGIAPRAAKIKRRIAYAVVFTFGIGIMQYFYLSGLVKQSTTPGPDLFLLAGIVPAGLILLLFSWTIGAANRERLKLAPSLEVVDELILEYGDKAIYETDARGKTARDEFGHPVKKEYTGMLAWFDLKGFTMTDGLRKIDERHRVEIDQFFADVDLDLSDLYHNLFPRFRFKWAGDELSWAYFAQTKEEADAMVVKAFDIWRKNAARLTAKWKADLIRRLGAHMDPAVVEAMEYVDVHVAFTRLDELKIKPGLFESKADYDSPSYTRISRAFKKSTHLYVAVFEDAGRTIAEKLRDSDQSVRWQPALTPERERELRTELEKNPSAIKKINEELMLAGTGFLVFNGHDAATPAETKTTAA